MRFESQLSRMNCQMFSCGLSSGHLAGSGIQGDVGGNLQAAGKTPSGLIEEDGGVSVRRNLRGDLGEMQVHRLGVATRHDERRAFALLGADRAKDIGRSGSLIARGAGARAALGPSPRDLVLLADASLVGEPDFYCAGIKRLSRARSLPGAREGFFKILDRILGLGVLAGASRKLAIAHLAQHAAECLLGDDDAEFLENPLPEIDDPPAHDPMNRRDRPALDDRRERRAIRLVEPRLLPRPCGQSGRQAPAR